MPHLPLLHTALRMARARLLALLAVVCAVVGGAAVVTATGVLAESGISSSLPAGRLADADVVVSADQTYPVAEEPDLTLPERARLSDDLVDRLADLPGVVAAVGDLSFPAAVVVDGQALADGDAGTDGHGWSTTDLTLDAAVRGTAPTGDDQVALGADLARRAGAQPGDTVQLVAAGSAADYRVSAVVDAPGMFFADDTAAELAERAGGARAGSVDLIALRTEPGAAPDVARAAQDVVGAAAVVSTGDDRGDAATPGAAAGRGLLLLLAGSLSGVVLLVVGFVVAGALGVVVAGQRRELALLRAIGATPGQVRRLVVGQALLVLAVAAVPGVALGYLLADAFDGLLTDLGTLPADLPLTVGPVPALATVVLLGAVVAVAALAAAWRTSRMPATEAVAASRTEPRSPSRVRAYIGAALMLSALVLAGTPLVARTDLGAAGVPTAGLLSALGLALAGPALMHGLADVVGRRLPDRPSAPTWLAAANLRGNTLRVAGVVASLAMLVLVPLTYVFGTTTLVDAGTRDAAAGTRAQVQITAGALGGLPTDLADDVRAVPGVTAVAATGSTTVLRTGEELGDPTVESASALVLDPAAADVLDLDVRSGDLVDLTGPTVAVSRQLADTRDLAVGDTTSLVLGDGAQVTARVVAVYGRDLGFGPVAVATDLVAGHTTSGPAQRLLVRTDGSATATAALDTLVADHPGTTLTDPTPDGGSLADAPAEVWINLATIAVLLGYLVLSIANKLVAVTGQRRREIAVLRLTGATSGQVLSMMRRESAAITAVALTTGLALSAAPLVAVGVGFLGRPLPAGPWWLLPGCAVLVAAIAFLTTELPTRRALRAEPATALTAAG